MKSGLLGSRIAACTMLWVVFSGCQDRPAGPQVVEAGLDLNTSPEAQLKHVERRMKDALDRAKAAAGTGVRSSRTCEFHLIPPADEAGPYTAEVVLITLVELDPEALKKGQPGQPNLKPIGEAAEDLAEQTAQTTRRPYKLAYRDGRWELTDPPVEDIPELDQACFAIALSDG
jgi:hypothetical protein